MALEPLLAQAIAIYASPRRERRPVPPPPRPSPVEPNEPRIDRDPKSKKQLFVSLRARPVYRHNSPFSQQRELVMKPQRHHRVWTLILREPDPTTLTQGRGTPPRRAVPDVRPILGRRTERDDDDNEDHEDARPTNRRRVA
ncbi:hypothetical protein PCANC_02302 [Puccinia coronata f. sp. avenae]|uniref:Uncharacterized protein n=1 Tax=Puccinia coronata f. sp. avenae TaxID=200324 RepID=A0A2N5VZF6_9BASI|nr:hypothetical protein PCASD_21615 [Puccinia coronata f. sp. avenae]PLW19039.1 hypothetical protein PCANC_09813 [Puccinia coronata f. sp. avenae]PLW52321.1 hypothetical protein PCASD_00134 [Puccinia coronata f. sp. avenae]PLW55360.1 hypothetical protein PCANC_02302 [Puccinia coronata f. sp. avenae]